MSETLIVSWEVFEKHASKLHDGSRRSAHMFPYYISHSEEL